VGAPDAAVRTRLTHETTNNACAAEEDSVRARSPLRRIAGR